MKSFVFEKFQILFVFLLCNLFLVPTESYDGSAATGFAQLVRVASLALLIAFFWIFFIPKKIIVRSGALAVLLLFVLAILISNLGSVRASFTLIFYPVVMTTLSFLLFVLSESSAKFRRILTSTLGWIVIFWVGSYLVQLVLFVAFGEVTDLHNFFFPYSAQRTEVVADGLVRLGGIHIEPGTFSNWLFGVLILRAILIRAIFDRVNLIGFIGLPASLSVWGFIATIFVVAAYFLHYRHAFVKGLLALLAAGVLLGALEVSYGLISDVQIYLESRSGSESSSTSTKYDAYTAFSSEAYKFILVGQDVTYEFCDNCWSVQDAGVLVNLASKIGIFLTLFVFLSFGMNLYARIGLAALVLAMPILWAKWFYWDPVFWLIVFFAFSRPCSGGQKVQHNV